MIRASVLLNRPAFRLHATFNTTSRVTGLFGPSGAGKTTLVNTIAGLVRPDSGSISITDETVFDSAKRIDIPAHRRGVGVVFQEHRLFPHMSVRNNLLYGNRRGRAELDRVTALFEIGGLLDRLPASLSGGERQRVALARALVMNPRALLLDEPLASVDARLKAQIIPYLRRCIEEAGVPVLYISHDLTEILQLTRSVMVLESGAVVGHGDIAEVLHEHSARGAIRDAAWSNVVTARIAAHRPDDGVTALALPTTDGAASTGPPITLVAPLCALPVGAPITVAIAPHDIALAGAQVAGISIQNQVRAVVGRITRDGNSVLVELDIGAPLIAEISPAAARDLRIAPGQPLVCLIKARSVRILTAADRPPPSAP